jgi:hypothetical protein
VTAERDSRKTGKHKKVCVTDPDTSMATNGRNRRLEPAYKQHAVVDDGAECFRRTCGAAECAERECHFQMAA